MQALMLAAGMGKRLGKYTKGSAKCMVEVAGEKLVDRVIEAVEQAGIERFIIVTGHAGEELRSYIEEKFKDSSIEFVFVHNSNYDKSNNIYSLYMAKEYLEQDDTILLESDLIFDKNIVKNVVQYPSENVVTVAKYEPWMDGTVTLLTEEDYIKEFVEKKDFKFKRKGEYYKTVNIYKFSKEFSQKTYVPFLEAYIKSYGTNEYYELVLKAISHLSCSCLKAYKLSNEKWYEIDDAQDLDIANTLFSKGEEKLKLFQKRFGGYWRFEGVKDYCYLVNPYFPPKRMVSQMKDNYLELLTQYPSGMYVQSINAGRMFGVDESEILVGNGAAEIINGLDTILQGSVGVTIPTFNEYVRCFRNCTLETIDSSKNDYRLSKEALIELSKRVDNLVIVNPDNPSGSFIKYEDLIEIIEACEARGTKIIIDESFIDFANEEVRYTLIDSKILNKYKNLMVIKSISKSYGVPGLRLGVIASSDKELLQRLKAAMAVWNINSFGEYFLQIITLYEKDYKAACNLIAAERNRFIEELKNISFLKVYPSQANYVLCELKDGFKSKEMAIELLEKDNVLIKDLGEKTTFEGKEFIRLAVRDEEDNNYLLNVLKAYE
ncbi:aminotransferase class I/II-fold pyridoxal phosphate-dependent enzyme [Clostridium culturomicium]|uniref:aminotransferase class I/II-fold pyridoxal phosphate-dependent enzyme n=1 Tax=Clostridium culturomicium TaxID=1499683 RepID=UPI003857DD7E